MVYALRPVAKQNELFLVGMVSALRPVAKQSEQNKLFLVEIKSNLMADTKQRAFSVSNYIRPHLFNDAKTD